jgi:hypothetical protein
MSAFETLKAEFGINWTTILVGWNGAGAFSPWPDRRDDFPPLLSVGELESFAAERLLLSSDVAEESLIVRLLSLNLRDAPRQAVREVLEGLANLSSADQTLELRKWRLVMLEALLGRVDKNLVKGLLTLTEFWQEFGFPQDSPHEVQGRDNELTASEYYQDSNLRRILDRHRDWVAMERAALEKQRSERSAD